MIAQPKDEPSGLATLTTAAPSKTASPTDTARPSSTPKATATPKASNTPSPTTTPKPTLTPPPAVYIILRGIYYNGITANESDEYAEVYNAGTEDVNLKGWRLNAGSPGQDFIFPDFTMKVGEMCRVYTNEIHAEWGGLSFGSKQPVWNNKGECGELFNPAGVMVSRRCYQ